MQHLFFDFGKLVPAARYKLLSGAVLPRPIALITTHDNEGIANAAPFSFFGLLSHDPPTLAVGIENHDDGRPKDTTRNIRQSGVFTVHIPDRKLAADVEICASSVAPEINELELAKLVTVPGRAVTSPRITSAPVALECVLRTTLDLGPSREVFIGEIVGFFIRDDAVNERLHVDPAAIDAIARLGGRSYSTTRDRFEL